MPRVISNTDKKDAFVPSMKLAWRRNFLSRNPVSLWLILQWTAPWQEKVIVFSVVTALGCQRTWS